MDIRSKLYQMFILGTSGGGYEKALENNLGGIIFFTPDIQNEEQFKTMIQKCRSLATTPPFLSIDQEGGRVERTENIHNGKKYLSAGYAYEKGLNFLENQTYKIAKELKNYGINLNFAPCVDVNTNPDNPIIGERAFSSNPDDVIKAEKIVSEAYRKMGIIPCAKHFPGHGDANADSHLTLPEINLSLEEMEKTHIKPFKACAKNIEMIMIAHLHCTCFEKNKIPASLSKNALDYLRQKLEFEGVTISDDMVMKGVAKFGTVEAIETGIRAGLNMFIYRNSAPETINAIELVAEKASKDKELSENIEKSFERIMKLKAKYLTKTTDNHL